MGETLPTPDKLKQQIKKAIKLMSNNPTNVTVGEDGLYTTEVSLTEDEPVENSTKDYLSKINESIYSNKPKMAILFNYFNILAHKKFDEDTPMFDNIELIGLLNRNDEFINNFPDTPPRTFTYKALVKMDNNTFIFSLTAFRENGEIRNFVRYTSLTPSATNSMFIFETIFSNAVKASNLKGSYLTIADNELEWKVKTLKEITFDDVFLPKHIMGELETYVKLFETKGILQRQLFCGIPGTGKTESIRGINNILNKQNVTIIKTNICEIIKDKFDLAAILAPSLVILDDLDLYLGDRNSGGTSKLLGAFLDILDGVDKLPGNVGVIASTNAPHLIDLAAQRPGRFNNVLFFDELESDNIKNIIKKSLNHMNDDYNNVTKEDIKLLTDKKLIKHFKDSGSTGAYIYETVKNIKHKQDIVGDDLILKDVISEIDKNYKLLQKKLNATQIKSKLTGNGSKDIGFD
tara:strand:+ start:4369 stop:5754 length:1386 start_codon:yes stop_codon:yes gene_type:complete